MPEKFKEDIEKTYISFSGEQTPSEVVLITRDLTNFAKAVISDELIDIRSSIRDELKETKREIEERINEIKSVQKDVKFTRKTTMWIIGISLISMIFTTLSFIFSWLKFP